MNEGYRFYVTVGDSSAYSDTEKLIIKAIIEQHATGSMRFTILLELRMMDNTAHKPVDQEELRGLTAKQSEKWANERFPGLDIVVESVKLQ